ncbi:hypothetical protein HDU93_005408 [Gonapodya sp. JEL0774]|nr:hypothetical protein HDU93_005408 [Gonapodya sp. JEL0774]
MEFHGPEMASTTRRKGKGGPRWAELVGAVLTTVTVALAVFSRVGYAQTTATTATGVTNGGCVCNSTCMVSTTGSTAPPFRDPVTGRAWDYCVGAALSSALGVPTMSLGATSSSQSLPTLSAFPSSSKSSPSSAIKTPTPSDAASIIAAPAPSPSAPEDSDHIVGLSRPVFYATVGAACGLALVSLLCCCWWLSTRNGRKREKMIRTEKGEVVVGTRDGKFLRNRPFSSASMSSVPYLPDLDLGTNLRFGDVFSSSFYRSASRSSQSSGGLFRSASAKSENGGATSPSSSPTPSEPKVVTSPTPAVGRMPSAGKGTGKTWSPMRPSPLNPFGRRQSTFSPAPPVVMSPPPGTAGAPPLAASPVSMLAGNPFTSSGTTRAVPTSTATGASTTNPAPTTTATFTPGHNRPPSLSTTLTSHLTDPHVAENPFTSDSSSIISAPSIRDANSPPPMGETPEPMDMDEMIEMGGIPGLAGRRGSTPIPTPYNNSGAAAGGTFTRRAGSPIVHGNPYSLEPVRADSPTQYTMGAYAIRSPSTSDSYDSTDSGLGMRSPPLTGQAMAPSSAVGSGSGIKVPPPKQPIPATVFHVTFHPPADGRLYAIEEYVPSGTVKDEIGLTPGDRVEVTEILGGGVVRGRNVDTGEEGVFPEWALGRGQVGRGTPVGGLAM